MSAHSPRPAERRAAYNNRKRAIIQ
jgi:hypothetical protein